MDLRFFDAVCQTGRRLKLQAGQDESESALLAEMDRFGIREALVVDALARENHPADGNRRVLATTAPHPRLHPAWAALPHGEPDEQLPGCEFVAAMRDHKVGAVFLYPEQYKFTLADWCVDAFLEPLANAGVPVFINPNEVGNAGWGWDHTDWEAVVALCRRHPELPVIVSEFRMRRSNRTIYRALDTCENLRIELSGYWLYHGIEYITRRWGAHRLIFGTNRPLLGQGLTVATVAMADVSDADKQKIAGDNLRKLLRWCEPEHPDVEIPPADDAYIELGRTGIRPADMTFVDNHGHLGGRACHYHLPDCDLAGTVDEMDRLGVEQACVFGFAGIFGDEQFGNDVVAEAVQSYPNRFIGFTTLNPHRGETGMREELERGAAMGLRGVKLIPHYQGYPEEGPLIDVACRWAHERKEIILNHSWGSVGQLTRLVDTYPDACYFTGHMTLAYAGLMARHPNIYVCTCPLLMPRACETAVATFGADRLMFGSDLQDLPVSWGLGPVLFAGIPESEKAMILGGNLRRVLEHYSRPRA